MFKCELTYKGGNHMTERMSFGFLLTVAVIVLGSCIGEETPSGNSLFIPPLLEDGNADPLVFEGSLEARKSNVSFMDGKTAGTFGYNLDYLGPTILVQKGTRARITLTNSLDISTTVHWHGVIVEPAMDGVFDEYGVIVEPGSAKVYDFPVNQDAATFWYHPHTMRDTGLQVYRGLAGFFIVGDPEGTYLPSVYGVTDIPIVIQDRSFATSGDLDYRLTSTDVMSGKKGDITLVNGKIRPRFEAPPAIIRLRLLNGSNAAFYSLGLTGGAELTLIATDGGYTDRPVRTNGVDLSPAERAEVLVDLRGSGGTTLRNTTRDGKTIDILRIEVTDESRRLFEKTIRDDPGLAQRVAEAAIPESLGQGGGFTEADAVATRYFELENPAEHSVHMAMMNGGSVTPEDVTLTINGKSFDMARVDFEVKAGSVEVWNVKSFQTMNMPGMPEMIHNFHIHGAQFKVLSTDGKKPDESLTGLKDTVPLWPFLEVKLLVKFGDYRGKHLFHCHILEHEDAGMAGTYVIR